MSTDEYTRKLEEQKKIREKLMAMKEKKRQQAAEQRRRELEQRLAAEGESLNRLCWDSARKRTVLVQGCIVSMSSRENSG